MISCLMFFSITADKYREFEVTLTKGHKKIIYRCDSMQERDSWIRVLSMLILDGR